MILLLQGNQSLTHASDTLSQLDIENNILVDGSAFSESELIYLELPEANSDLPFANLQQPYVSYVEDATQWHKVQPASGSELANLHLWQKRIVFPAEVTGIILQVEQIGNGELQLQTSGGVAFEVEHISAGLWLSFNSISQSTPTLILQYAQSDQISNPVEQGLSIQGYYLLLEPEIDCASANCIDNESSEIDDLISAYELIVPNLFDADGNHFARKCRAQLLHDENTAMDYLVAQASCISDDPDQLNWSTIPDVYLFSGETRCQGLGNRTLLGAGVQIEHFALDRDLIFLHSDLLSNLNDIAHIGSVELAYDQLLSSDGQTVQLSGYYNWVDNDIQACTQSILQDCPLGAVQANQHHLSAGELLTKHDKALGFVLADTNIQSSCEDTTAQLQYYAKLDASSPTIQVTLATELNNWAEASEEQTALPVYQPRTHSPPQLATIARSQEGSILGIHTALSYTGLVKVGIFAPVQLLDPDVTYGSGDYQGYFTHFADFNRINNTNVQVDDLVSGRVWVTLGRIKNYRMEYRGSSPNINNGDQHLQTINMSRESFSIDDGGDYPFWSQEFRVEKSFTRFTVSIYGFQLVGLCTTEVVDNVRNCMPSSNDPLNPRTQAQVAEVFSKSVHTIYANETNVYRAFPVVYEASNQSGWALYATLNHSFPPTLRYRDEEDTISLTLASLQANISALYDYGISFERLTLEVDEKNFIMIQKPDTLNDRLPVNLLPGDISIYPRYNQHSGGLFAHDDRGDIIAGVSENIGYVHYLRTGNYQLYNHPGKFSLAFGMPQSDGIYLYWYQYLGNKKDFLLLGEQSGISVGIFADQTKVFSEFVDYRTRSFGDYHLSEDVLNNADEFRAEVSPYFRAGDYEIPNDQLNFGIKTIYFNPSRWEPNLEVNQSEINQFELSFSTYNTVQLYEMVYQNVEHNEAVAVTSTLSLSQPSDTTLAHTVTNVSGTLKIDISPLHVQREVDFTHDPYWTYFGEVYNTVTTAISTLRMNNNRWEYNFIVNDWNANFSIIANNQGDILGNRRIGISYNLPIVGNSFNSANQWFVLDNLLDELPASSLQEQQCQIDHTYSCTPNFEVLNFPSDRRFGVERLTATIRLRPSIYSLQLYYEDDQIAGVQQAQDRHTVSNFRFTLALATLNFQRRTYPQMSFIGNSLQASMHVNRESAQSLPDYPFDHYRFIVEDQQVGDELTSDQLTHLILERDELEPIEYFSQMYDLALNGYTLGLHSYRENHGISISGHFYAHRLMTLFPLKFSHSQPTPEQLEIIWSDTDVILPEHTISRIYLREQASSAIIYQQEQIDHVRSFTLTQAQLDESVVHLLSAGNSVSLVLHADYLPISDTGETISIHSAVYPIVMLGRPSLSVHTADNEITEFHWQAKGADEYFLYINDEIADGPLTLGSYTLTEQSQLGQYDSANFYQVQARNHDADFFSAAYPHAEGAVEISLNYTKGGKFDATGLIQPTNEHDRYFNLSWNLGVGSTIGITSLAIWQDGQLLTQIPFSQFTTDKSQMHFAQKIDQAQLAEDYQPAADLEFRFYRTEEQVDVINSFSSADRYLPSGANPLSVSLAYDLDQERFEISWLRLGAGDGSLVNDELAQNIEGYAYKFNHYQPYTVVTEPGQSFNQAQLSQNQQTIVFAFDPPPEDSASITVQHQIRFAALTDSDPYLKINQFSDDLPASYDQSTVQMQIVSTPQITLQHTPGIINISLAQPNVAGQYQLLNENNQLLTVFSANSQGVYLYDYSQTNAIALSLRLLAIDENLVASPSAWQQVPLLPVDNFNSKYFLASPDGGGQLLSATVAWQLPTLGYPSRIDGDNLSLQFIREKDGNTSSLYLPIDATNHNFAIDPSSPALGTLRLRVVQLDEEQAKYFTESEVELIDNNNFPQEFSTDMLTIGYDEAINKLPLLLQNDVDYPIKINWPTNENASYYRFELFGYDAQDNLLSLDRVDILPNNEDGQAQAEQIWQLTPNQQYMFRISQVYRGTRYSDNFVYGVAQKAIHVPVRPQIDLTRSGQIQNYAGLRIAMQVGQRHIYDAVEVNLNGQLQRLANLHAVDYYVCVKHVYAEVEYCEVRPDNEHAWVRLEAATPLGIIHSVPLTLYQPVQIEQWQLQNADYQHIDLALVISAIEGSAIADYHILRNNQPRMTLLPSASGTLHATINILPEEEIGQIKIETRAIAPDGSHAVVAQSVLAYLSQSYGTVSEFSYSLQDSQGAKLSWHSIANATEYQLIELTGESQNEKLLHKVDMPNPVRGEIIQASLSLSAGVHTVELRSKYVNEYIAGELWLASEPLLVSVLTEPDFSISHIDDVNRNLKITWQPQTLASGYILYIDDTHNIRLAATEHEYDYIYTDRQRPLQINLAAYNAAGTVTAQAQAVNQPQPTDFTVRFSSSENNIYAVASWNLPQAYEEQLDGQPISLMLIRSNAESIRQTIIFVPRGRLEASVALNNSDLTLGDWYLAAVTFANQLPTILAETQVSFSDYHNIPVAASEIELSLTGELLGTRNISPYSEARMSLMFNLGQIPADQHRIVIQKQDDNIAQPFIYVQAQTVAANLAAGTFIGDVGDKYQIYVESKYLPEQSPAYVTNFAYRSSATVIQIPARPVIDVTNSSLNQNSATIAWQLNTPEVFTQAALLIDGIEQADVFNSDGLAVQGIYACTHTLEQCNLRSENHPTVRIRAHSDYGVLWSAPYTFFQPVQQPTWQLSARADEKIIVNLAFSPVIHPDIEYYQIIRNSQTVAQIVPEQSSRASFVLPHAEALGQLAINTYASVNQVATTLVASKVLPYSAVILQAVQGLEYQLERPGSFRLQWQPISTADDYLINATSGNSTTTYTVANDSSHEVINYELSAAGERITIEIVTRYSSAQIIGTIGINSTPLQVDSIGDLDFNIKTVDDVQGQIEFAWNSQAHATGYQLYFDDNTTIQLPADADAYVHTYVNQQLQRPRQAYLRVMHELGALRPEMLEIDYPTPANLDIKYGSRLGSSSGIDEIFARASWQLYQPYPAAIDQYRVSLLLTRSQAGQVQTLLLSSDTQSVDISIDYAKPTLGTISLKAIYVDIEDEQHILSGTEVSYINNSSFVNETQNLSYGLDPQVLGKDNYQSFQNTSVVLSFTADTQPTGNYRVINQHLATDRVQTIEAHAAIGETYSTHLSVDVGERYKVWIENFYDNPQYLPGFLYRSANLTINIPGRPAIDYVNSQVDRQLANLHWQMSTPHFYHNVSLFISDIVHSHALADFRAEASGVFICEHNPLTACDLRSVAHITIRLQANTELGTLWSKPYIFYQPATDILATVSNSPAQNGLLVDLNWQPNPHQDIIGYQIERNDLEIARVLGATANHVQFSLDYNLQLGKIRVNSLGQAAADQSINLARSSLFINHFAAEKPFISDILLPEQKTYRLTWLPSADATAYEIFDISDAQPTLLASLPADAYEFSAQANPDRITRLFLQAQYNDPTLTPEPLLISSEPILISVLLQPSLNIHLIDDESGLIDLSWDRQFGAENYLLMADSSTLAVLASDRSSYVLDYVNENNDVRPRYLGMEVRNDFGAVSDEATYVPLQQPHHFRGMFTIVHAPEDGEQNLGLNINWQLPRNYPAQIDGSRVSLRVIRKFDGLSQTMYLPSDARETSILLSHPQAVIGSLSLDLIKLNADNTPSVFIETAVSDVNSVDSPHSLEDVKLHADSHIITAQNAYHDLEMSVLWSTVGSTARDNISLQILQVNDDNSFNEIAHDYITTLQINNVAQSSTLGISKFTAQIDQRYRIKIGRVYPNNPAYASNFFYGGEEIEFTMPARPSLDIVRSQYDRQSGSLQMHSSSKVYSEFPVEVYLAGQKLPTEKITNQHNRYAVNCTNLQVNCTYLGPLEPHPEAYLLMLTPFGDIVSPKIRLYDSVDDLSAKFVNDPNNPTNVMLSVSWNPYPHADIMRYEIVYDNGIDTQNTKTIYVNSTDFALLPPNSENRPINLSINSIMRANASADAPSQTVSSSEYQHNASFVTPTMTMVNTNAPESFNLAWPNIPDAQSIRIQAKRLGADAFQSISTLDASVNSYVGSLSAGQETEIRLLVDLIGAGYQDVVTVNSASSAMESMSKLEVQWQESTQHDKLEMGWDPVIGASEYKLEVNYKIVPETEIQLTDFQYTYEYGEQARPYQVRLHAQNQFGTVSSEEILLPPLVTVNSVGGGGGGGGGCSANQLTLSPDQQLSENNKSQWLLWLIVIALGQLVRSAIAQRLAQVSNIS